MNPVSYLIRQTTESMKMQVQKEHVGEVYVRGSFYLAPGPDKTQKAGYGVIFLKKRSFTSKE
jgi:hypothetical protein